MIYRITHWNRRHENNRSRELKDASWVAVPNSMDGDGYVGIVDGSIDGALAYAGWVAILLVASRCSPRGDLIQSHGAPHTSKTLAAKTRMPVRVINLAIQRSLQVGWLQEVADSGVVPIPHPVGTCLREGAVPSNRKERNGKEQEGKSSSSDDVTTTRGEVAETCGASGPAGASSPPVAPPASVRPATIDRDSLWQRLEAMRGSALSSYDRKLYADAAMRWAMMPDVLIGGERVAAARLFERVGLAVIALPRERFQYKSMTGFLNYCASWFTTCEADACWPENTDRIAGNAAPAQQHDPAAIVAAALAQNDRTRKPKVPA